MNVIVVIPVYKEPDTYEIVSLRRCCEVLNKYDVTLVCPNSLDTFSFHVIWSEYNLMLKDNRFDDEYFKTIAGYNRLLLSEEFYRRFEKYDYMLIYQPDAYVFEDKLLEWCNKGYDYIGAPFVGDYSNWEYSEEMTMVVGNGGFSLRRISTFINFFICNQKVFNSKQIIKSINFWKKPHTRWLVWILMMLGWHNKPKYFSKNYKWNEDGFWSLLLSDSQYALKIPSAVEALEFAFERFPREMYKITKKLPFGCHAWKKYEFEEYWKYYIK